MDDNFTSKVKKTIALSKEEAVSVGDKIIGTHHLFLGLMKTGSLGLSLLFKALNITAGDLAFRFSEDFLLHPVLKEIDKPEKFRLSRQAEKALKTTFLEAKLYNSPAVNTLHLLLCILRNENDSTTKFLNEYGLNYNYVKKIYLKFQNKIERNESNASATATEIEVTDSNKQDNGPPETPPTLISVEEVDNIEKPPTISKITQFEFEPKPSSISLYFHMDEYSTDDIAEMVSLLSDLYREMGGEGLVIKGQDILEYDSVLEPILA